MSTTAGFRELLDSDEFDFRYTAGLAQPTSNLELKDRDRIVASLAMHFSIMHCMTELIQLKEGLSELNVLHLLQSHPHVVRPLLVFSSAKRLTVDKLYDLFEANLSPIGSNRRETEESVYMHWITLMEEIGGKEFFNPLDPPEFQNYIVSPPPIGTLYVHSVLMCNPMLG